MKRNGSKFLVGVALMVLLVRGDLIPAHAGPALAARSQQPPAVEPLVEVGDQWIRNGEVIINRVVLFQPGWVDIHAEAAAPGQPGAVIGYAPIVAGETTDIRVPVDPTATTPIMFAVLHLDGGAEGTFEFPGPDIPVQIAGHTLVAPFRLLGQAAAEPAAAPVATVEPTATAGGATGTPTRAPAPTASDAASPSARDYDGNAGPEQAVPQPEWLPAAGGRLPAAPVSQVGILLLLSGLGMWVHDRRRNG